MHTILNGGCGGTVFYISPKQYQPFKFPRKRDGTKHCIVTSFEQLIIDPMRKIEIH